MAFTVTDVRDLIRLLAEHPEWRAELRPLILGDEFQELPGIVRDLGEAQRRTESNLAALTQEVRALGADVRALTADVKALTEEVRALSADVKALTVGLGTLSGTVGELGREVAEYVGPTYELLFGLKASSLFGPWLRRPRATGVGDLERLDDAVESGLLSQKELDSLYALDLLILGGDRQTAGFPETLVAVEISRTIDRGDIERAIGRAELLRRLGYLALPAVGGREIGPREQQFADEQKVIVRLVNQVA